MGIRNISSITQFVVRPLNVVEAKFSGKNMKTNELFISLKSKINLSNIVEMFHKRSPGFEARLAKTAMFTNGTWCM